MSGLYEELLTATIERLEELKAGGTKFVPVSAEALAGLGAEERSSPLSTSSAATRTGASAGPSRSAPAAGRTTPSTGTRRAVATPASAAPPAAVGLMTQRTPFADSEALIPEAKARAMEELRVQAMACVTCPHLASSRKNVVFGVGDVNASLMFAGEAPGGDEDAQGEPFVGKAGQLLTRIIQTMGFSRETVYIGNVLKCRPDTPGQSYGNRKPTPEEMQTCLPYLERQIEIIRPKVIVALGATAVEGLLGLESAGITRLRGNWREFRGIPVMPTFHPSFLLRPENASKKRLVWEDMLLVMERIGAPISEKQRGFFLKPS
jgi:DNA polymerase